MPGNIVSLSPEDIAKWPKPNYVDPERRVWMPEYAGVLYGVATVLVATRLLLRARKQAGGLGLDDAFLTGAWMSVSWFTGLSIVGSEVYMTSRHMWDIPVGIYENIAKIIWIAELAFLVTGCLIKVSALLFYRRIVHNACSRYWIWAVIAAISFTVAYTLAFIFVLIFNCDPTEAYWRAFSPSYTHNYTCVNTTALNLLAGILAAVSDLYSVALPCFMAWNLHLPQRQKIALYFLFATGLLVVGASAARTYYLYEVGHESDVSTCVFYVFVWAQLELCLGMICASLPALRVLFREYLSLPLSKFKVTSRRRGTDIEEVIITRPETPDDIQRSDFDTKHSVTSSITSMPAAIMEETREPVSPTTWSINDHHLVKTPADYESFNLQNMEKYRQSPRTTRSVEWIRSKAEDKQIPDTKSHSWLSIEDSK